MAVASLVLGILSLVFGWCLFFIGLPLAVVGLILGIADSSGSGMRTAGIVLNIIGLAVSSIWVVLMIIA